MLFNDETWDRYVEKIESNFKLKKYPHLDPYFDFPQQKEKLKSILSGVENNSVVSHSFLPLVKILIKTPRYKYQSELQKYKLETKIRPISFASHFDTYIYSFYSFVLTEKYQEYIKVKSFDECVLAYRSDLNGKCNIQFAKEVFDKVKLQKTCTAIALDIKGYFDHIDHQILKEKWCKILDVPTLPPDQYKVFISLTKYSYINKNSILKHFGINLKKQEKKWQTLLDLIPDEQAGSSFKDKLNLLRTRNLIIQNSSNETLPNGKKRHYGIPQGSAMSAVLSNIYLIDFDAHLVERGRKEGFIYRRYCDDILIIGSSDIVPGIYQSIKEKIKEYHLDIQDRKTEIIEFKENSKGNIRSFNRKKIEEENIELNPDNEEKYYKNLQYLGFEFNGQNTYIRPGSLSRYFRKMKGRIVKTIMMAHGPNSKSPKIFKQQIFHRYTHLGRRNFLTYAYNASKKYYLNSKGEKREGMDSPNIRRQISRHFDILLKEIEKTNEQRAMQKED